MNVKETPWDPSQCSLPVIVNPQVTCFQAFLTAATVSTTKDLTRSLCSWADEGWMGDHVPQWPWRTSFCKHTPAAVAGVSNGGDSATSPPSSASFVCDGRKQSVPKGLTSTVPLCKKLQVKHVQRELENLKVPQGEMHYKITDSLNWGGPLMHPRQIQECGRKCIFHSVANTTSIKREPTQGSLELTTGVFSFATLNFFLCHSDSKDLTPSIHSGWMGSTLWKCIWNWEIKLSKVYHF